MFELRALILVVVLAAPSAVRADGPEQSMQDYLAGEKVGGVSLLAMGAAGLGGGAFLATRDADFSKGLGYPLLGIGALHAAAGVFIIVTSNRRIKKSGPWIERDAEDFVTTEHARVQGVQTQFLVLKIVEVILIAGGVGLVVYGERENRSTLSGIGAGIAIEAGATLIFDIVAARRAARYVGELDTLRVTIWPGPSGTLIGAAYTLRF